MDAGQKNLTVLTDAKVLKVTFNGTRCTGLWFIMNSKSYSADISNEVILSAGAINTPRIQMLSGASAKQDVGFEGNALIRLMSAFAEHQLPCQAP